MKPITLCLAILVSCFAVNHGQLTGGTAEYPSVNFSDFPPPVPNAPDLQQTGRYPSRNSIGSTGMLSGALSNQNMIMEPSGGMEFGLQGSGLGRQTAGLGMGSGSNQMSPGLNGMSSGLNGMSSGLNGMNSGVNGMGSGLNAMGSGLNGMGTGLSQSPSSMGSLGATDFGSLGSVDSSMGSMGMGGMDVNSGFGNPGGSFGEIPNAQPLDPGMGGFSGAAGQMTGGRGGMSSMDVYQPNRNFYMNGPTPVVPGARGMTMNFSRRPIGFLRPPPIILLPPPQPLPRRGLFSLFQRRQPRPYLVPIGPPMPIRF